MKQKNNHLVIMAGGVGSRFWPMSTPECPKQFIDVLGCGRTLIQLTVDRFHDICLPENIWIVTSKKYVSIVKEQLPEIPDTNILQEPCMRNTAPCIAYVSWKIFKKDPCANIVVTPSDQFVLNLNEFQRIISEALRFSSVNDDILTLGIKPSRPETGYGYIKANLINSNEDYKSIYPVEAFKEKPDKATAEKYLADSSYFWNSGIFVWNIHTILSSIKKHQPLIADIFENISSSFFTEVEQDEIDNYFPDCPNISIDYGIMEKSDSIYVIPSDFGWSDLGTWGSLHAQLSRDKNNNACVGSDIELVESENCIVHTLQEKKVLIQGLTGYIVAEKDNVLLICKLQEEQRIKEFLKSK